MVDPVGDGAGSLSFDGLSAFTAAGSGSGGEHFGAGLELGDRLAVDLSAAAFVLWWLPSFDLLSLLDFEIGDGSGSDC